MKKLISALAVTAAIAMAPAAAWAEDIESEPTAVEYGVEAESGIAVEDGEPVVTEEGETLVSVEDGEEVPVEDGEVVAYEDGGEVAVGEEMLRTTAMPMETPAEEGAPLGLFAGLAAAAAAAVVWFKRKSAGSNA